MSQDVAITLLFNKSSICSIVANEFRYAIRLVNYERLEGKYYPDLDPIWIVERVKKFEQELGIEFIDVELKAIVPDPSKVEYVQSFFMNGYVVDVYGFALNIKVRVNKKIDENELRNKIQDFLNKLCEIYKRNYSKVNELLINSQ